MSMETAQMIDMLLRVVGMSIIQGMVQAVCLALGALFVYAVIRVTKG